MLNNRNCNSVPLIIKHINNLIKYDKSSTNLGNGRGRNPARNLQKSFSTESSLNHMVPNSPIHPDAAMGGDSRDSSPTKGNRTPGRKLSPPKHLEAPIVEVTENESSEEKSRRASEDKTNEGNAIF